MTTATRTRPAALHLTPGAEARIAALMSRAPEGAAMKAPGARSGSVTTARARRLTGEGAEGVAGDGVTPGQ